MNVSYATIARALIAGFLIGLIPFFIGRKKKHEDTGIVCLMLCMVCSFIDGLYLSVTACLVSVLIILISGNKNNKIPPPSDEQKNINSDGDYIIK